MTQKTTSMVNLHTGPVEREKKKLDFNLPFGPIENRLQTPDDLLGTEDVWLFLFHELIYVSDVPVAEALVHAKTPETIVCNDYLQFAES